MINRISSRLFWVFLLFYSAVAVGEITISTDRTKAYVDESLQIYFVADGSVDGDPDFSPIQTYFSILNTSQSSNISIVNGNYKRSIKWTLQLLPLQAGRVVIPAIHFGKDRSEPFEIQVEAARQATNPGDSGLIFEIESDQPRIYVQEQILLTLRLLSDSNISGYQFGNINLNNTDVIVEPLGDITQYQTKINNRDYLVLEKKYALFPQKAGDLSIGPIRAEVKLGSRSQSLFDPFQSSGQLIRLQSNKLGIEVRSQVEEFAAAHWLPSTGVQLSEVWQGDLDQMSAGVPVTRTVTLTAEGLTAVQLPELAQTDIQGVKQYPDTPVLNDRRSGAGIVGKREQKIALIATAEGIYQIPEIAIPWWNLETEQLEIARIPARTINVGAGTELGLSPQPGLEPGSSPTHSASGVRVETNYFWIWLSAFLATGWLLSILAWWISRRRAQLATLGVRKPAAVSLSKATRKLRQACTRNDPGLARAALVPWANGLIPDRQFTNLNQLVQYFDQPLKQAIDDLNQGLYSDVQQDWDASALWSCCEDLAVEYNNSVGETTDAGLLPLNP